VTSEERELVEALERRVASLEAAVRALSAGRDESRVEQRPIPQPYMSPPPEPRPASWMPKEIDVESLIGRYGTLVLATVSALAAVGTFLGWAIAQGLLGPTQRIALGLLLSAALAVAGLRLRRRERSFGASLLGLSLAIAHVCAWAAGPSLKLVPSWGAFLFAAVASIALAVFAHGENDEPLWSVGFSGAALAPFVTASGKSNLLLLSAYGILVLSSAGYAMGGRRWIVAGRLFLLAAAAYTLALATGFERQYGPLLAMSFPLFVAASGVVPWTAGWPRRERLRAMGALAALSALRAGMGMNLPLSPARIAVIIAAAGLAWLVLLDRTHRVAAPEGAPTARRLHEGDWLDAGVLPLGFILAALMALDASARGSGFAMAAAAAVLLMAIARFPQGSLRDAAAFAAVICALVAELLILREHGELLIVGVAALSVLCFAANVVWPSVSWTTLALIGLAWTALASLLDLSGRTRYEYTPFLTTESAVAMAVLASLLTAWWLARDATIKRVLRGAAMVWAFAWVHQEIAFAVNETVATLLRVTYYAATSVAAVGAGRARQMPLLRHVGLGLAVLAAATALYGARNLDAIAARIGADLVSAVFLLAIAYWDRRPGAARDAAPARVGQA
jgi:hypothetical protein